MRFYIFCIFYLLTSNYNANRNEHVRKSLIIYETQLVDGSSLKKLIYFEVMLNILEFSWV